MTISLFIDFMVTAISAPLRYRAASSDVSGAFTN